MERRYNIQTDRQKMDKNPHESIGPGELIMLIFRSIASFLKTLPYQTFIVSLKILGVHLFMMILFSKIKYDHNNYQSTNGTSGKKLWFLCCRLICFCVEYGFQYSSVFYSLTSADKGR